MIHIFQVKSLYLSNLSFFLLYPILLTPLFLLISSYRVVMEAFDFFKNVRREGTKFEYLVSYLFEPPYSSNSSAESTFSVSQHTPLKVKSFATTQFDNAVSSMHTLSRPPRDSSSVKEKANWNIVSEDVKDPLADKHHSRRKKRQIPLSATDDQEKESSTSETSGSDSSDDSAAIATHSHTDSTATDSNQQKLSSLVPDAFKCAVVKLFNSILSKCEFLSLRMQHRAQFENAGFHKALKVSIFYCMIYHY